MIDFLNTWQENGDYLRMVKLMGQLSNLFSESNIPYIHYRITENLFCKYFKANNLARTDTAYDAKLGDLGIGIKTFQLKAEHKSEKVAEFNALSHKLRALNGIELAQMLAFYRNERIEVANNLYDIKKPIYHIIGRSEGKLQIFNTPYDLINFNEIKVDKDNETSLWFHDDKNQYCFNKSKSVLLKDFLVPNEKYILDVEIIEDPYALLENLLMRSQETQDVSVRRPYVVLPLFSIKGRKGNKEKFVYEKSGLNQWNASGRLRDDNEVYIPVPVELRNEFPDFFPSRDVPFDLYLPDGKKLSAKICQENGKALMSNPNSDLGEWLLRKILKKDPGHILTYQDLQQAGFDSIIVYKNTDNSYSIDVSFSESYNYKSLSDN